MINVLTIASLYTYPLWSLVAGRVRVKVKRKVRRKSNLKSKSKNEKVILKVKVEYIPHYLYRNLLSFVSRHSMRMQLIDKKKIIAVSVGRHFDYVPL